MPFQGVVVDESVLSEGFSQNPLLPEGYYLFGVVKVRPSAESADKPLHFYDLVTKDGPAGAGVAFTHFGRFADPSAPDKRMSWTWGRLVRSAGINPEPILKANLSTYKAFSALAEKLTGLLKPKSFGATVAHTNNSGNLRAEIIEFWPASEWESKKNLGFSSGVTPANGTAGPAGASDEEIGSKLDDLLGEGTL